MICKLKDPACKADLTNRNWHVVSIMVPLPVVQMQLTLPDFIFWTHSRFCGTSGGSEKEADDCVMHEISLQSFKVSTLAKVIRFNPLICHLD